MKETRTIEELLAEVALLREQLNLKDEVIAQKSEQILLLQRQLYGRRSEKRLPDYNKAQLSMFSLWEGEEMLEEEKEILVSVVEEVKEEAKKRRETTPKEKKHIARSYKLPDNLRRERLVLEPEGIDFNEVTKVSDKVTEVLMYTPGEFWVKQIIRPKYKAKKETQDLRTIFYQHPILPSILPGCMADSSVLSQVIIDKYQHHLPENRQIERFKATGLKFTPSTMNRWVHKVADKLYLLYKLQMDDILNCDYIQVDETTQQIADRVGKTRKGYVWVVRSVMNKSVFYYYQEGSRSRETLLKMLKDYQGALQSDGYAAYSIYEDKQGVLPLGCMAHVRRKFENALATTPDAQQALEYISLLYMIEANLKVTKN